MKQVKVIPYVLSLILALGAIKPAYAAENDSTTSQSVVEKDISQLSREELLQGLGELNLVHANLLEDLKSAEKLEDGRMAVKVRNYSLGAAALTVAGALIWIASTEKANAMPVVGISFFVGGAIVIATVVVAGVAEARILLTPSEADKVEKKIVEIQTRISAITQKLTAKK